MPEIIMNGMKLNPADNTTILDAARAAGIKIPTLCFLEGKTPLGACRVCIVEIEGSQALSASCCTPVRQGMVIHTNSLRVRNARRMIVELLLSEHEGDCQYCDRSEDCELKKLANELGIRAPKYTGEKTGSKIDDTTPAIIRDSGKCIKCRRCVTVCNAVQNVGAIFPQGRGFETTISPAFAAGLDSVACVQCGQCTAVCPVGAIIERDHTKGVWAALDDPKKHVVVQTAPAIRASLGEAFDLPPGTLVTGRMVTALRHMGFDAIFDTNFTADLTIIEEGNELLKRLKTVLVDGGEAALPQFTSCSPGWIKFAEYFYPEFLPNISTCKSPQQMFGALAKTYYAEKKGINPEDVIVVSVMPCTAKKYECQREEMYDSGYQDVDYVLTTRELGRMIKQAGLNFIELPESEMDAPLGMSSGAADIFANTGGVMEAALRTVYEVVTGRPLPMENLHVTPLTTLEGVKTASLKIEGAVPDWSFLEGVEVRVAVAHGLDNASRLLETIKDGKENFHFVEVMTCPGGCIGGGGQPRYTTDEIRKARIEAIFKEDEGKALRKSHDNPAIIQIYEEFLGQPLGEKSHHLLHTCYQKREKVLQ
ncbi:MAG: iron hydrogenase small subunit [Spirochaetes bacterium]|nr:iron hydrogenase small subunit [Spirochaetota bacterium]